MTMATYTEQLENELKLRVDSASELRNHLRSCNAEVFQLKKRIKELEEELRSNQEAK